MCGNERIMLIIKKLVKIDHINSYVYKILQLNFFKIIYIYNINLRVTLMPQFLSQLIHVVSDKR